MTIFPELFFIFILFFYILIHVDATVRWGSKYVKWNILILYVDYT